MEAARTAGAFARPLPLFYALSQGGRAILAAKGSDPWVVRGHGLRETSLCDPIINSSIEPIRSGLFPRVCEVLNTGPLTGSVELGAIWRAIPELANTFPPVLLGPRALRVFPEDTAGAFHMFKGGGTIVVPYEHRTADFAADLQQNYPNATDAHLAAIPGAGYQMARTPLGNGYVARWGSTNQSQPTGTWQEAVFEEAVPSHRIRGEHWLIPTVGTSFDSLSPFALWWVLLFTLSLIARYEPAIWKRALDPDSSSLAVFIEDALQEATRVVPHLLLIGLVGDSWIVPPETPGL
jgi:hypothetical protein